MVKGLGSEVRLGFSLIVCLHGSILYSSNRNFRSRPLREVVKLGAFILLGIGTIGLLSNEFIFDWGRVATLIFAFFNFVGLAILAFSYWGMKKA